MTNLLVEFKDDILTGCRLEDKDCIMHVIQFSSELGLALYCTDPLKYCPLPEEYVNYKNNLKCFMGRGVIGVAHMSYIGHTR